MSSETSAPPRNSLTSRASSLTTSTARFVAWGFVLITFLLVLLLSELFQLIGIGLLHDLLDKEWFPWLLNGGALGAAGALDGAAGMRRRIKWGAI